MRQSVMNTALFVALLAGGVPSFAQTVPPGGKQQVDKLIAVLKSDAPQKDKADACRQLAAIGTKDAVPALAALLGDEKLSHIARYALEPMPDPAVDDALREALGKVKGRPLVGVIDSLGVRRDEKAVEPLAKLLQDADADVAQTAARALGSIGTSAAAKALEGALAKPFSANPLALYEGLFRAAEALAAKGLRDEAAAIYDRLRGLEKAPHQVRTGALRGAILVRGEGGLALLREHLKSKDYLLFAAAVATAQELPGAEVTKTLCAGLGELPADNQVLVIQALAQRRGTDAESALSKAAGSGPKPVRLAAIRAYGQETDVRRPSGIIKLIDDPDPEIAQAAQDALVSLHCPAVDSLVMEMLEKGETPRRLLALELIGKRRMMEALPALLKAAGDADAGVRGAALKRLGELGGPAELPALLNLLMAAKVEDLGAAEQAVSAVGARADDPQSCAEKIAALLAQAQPAQKSALVRVLGAVGGPNALKAVRDCLKESNAAVRAAAIRTLGNWKSADAVPDLLGLAQNAADPTDKMLGLRGYLGWAAKDNVPAEQRISMCRQAAGLVQKPEEKKLLLAALGSITSPEAIVLIVPYLDEAATRNEAVAAAVPVAEKLLKGRDASQVASKLIGPLEKVSQVATDADLAARAKAALQQAQRRAKQK